MPRAAGEQQNCGLVQEIWDGAPGRSHGSEKKLGKWYVESVFSQSRFWNQSWLGSAPRGAESPVLCSRRREGPKLLGSPKITGRWLWFSREESVEDYGAVVEGN